jgi:predicted Zn finger-like uncharacterized protein
MRITCPNCGAQYAVDDRLIPDEGRDVQCSSCGHTWFQLHPDAQLEPEEPPVEETLPRREPDPEAMSILREEAERERLARAAEARPLESQAELAMEPPAPPRPSVAPADAAAPDAPDAPHAAPRSEGLEGLSDAERAERPAPRRSRLPDIEEINSSLSEEGQRPEEAEEPGPVAVAQRRAREGQGRRLGFGLAVALFAAATMLYAQGPRIAAAVPAFAPALSAYVGAVDRGRLWLDAALRSAVSPSAEGGEAQG